MTGVEADLEAIEDLRAALITFAGRQLDALDAAESEIALTLRALADEERRSRHEVERRRGYLESCLREAQNAAQQGYWIDCSSFEFALSQAEDRLDELLHWQRRVDDEVSSYRSAAQRVQSTLKDDLSRANFFLSDRITALEAYQAAQVIGAAVALASAGVATMGAVIGAFHHIQGEINRVMGSVGEQVTAQVLSERFALTELPFDQPKHGIDRVFRAPGIPLIVVESKVSSSGQLRLGQTQAGSQGSPGWVAAQSMAMTDRSSAQWSPTNERIGRLIQEIGPEKVPVLTVVVNPNTKVADVYQRTSTGWRLLSTEPGLDQLQQD